MVLRIVKKIGNNAILDFTPETPGNGSGDMLAANNLSDLTDITVARSNLGLGNVNNTSDSSKPISTATQTALDLKADLASPTFTGTVSGITKSMVGLSNVDNTSDANKPISTATQTALDGKVDENSSITGATKTKITYDSKGLVTAGADATTADIADSLNKRYVTDAQLTVIGNTSGTNTGDQTSIVGITGTKAQFDTAVTDGNFLYVGDVTQYTDELAQDAIGSMIDTTLVYTDGTPLLSRAALTGAITASAGSNTTALGSFNLSQLNTALSDADVATLSGSESLTNKKLGSLTTNGFVKTSGGDGTLSVDTASYQPLDTQLTDLAGLSYASNGLKFLRVNTGETGWELATIAGGGDVTGDDTSTTAQNIVAYTGTGGKNITELTGSQGDTLYHNGTSWVKLAKGTAGQILRINSGATAPEWVNKYVLAASLASPQATGANVTPVTLTGLVWTFEANSTYVFRFLGTVTPAAATTGCGFQLDVSAAVTTISMSFVHQLANTGTLSGGHSVADDASVGVSSGMPGTSTYPIQGQGLLITGANTGTAQLRFRSETTAVTTCNTGFTLIVEKVI
jgi:hypothetical protein